MDAINKKQNCNSDEVWKFKLILIVNYYFLGAIYYIEIYKYTYLKPKILLQTFLFKNEMGSTSLTSNQQITKSIKRDQNYQKIL